jgi:virulence-associated protein VagC
MGLPGNANSLATTIKKAITLPIAELEADRVTISVSSTRLAINPISVWFSGF